MFCGMLNRKRALFPFVFTLFTASCNGNVIVEPDPPECADNEDMCSGKCTDLLTDSDNCGACGASCGGTICEGGVCTTTPVECPLGYTKCGLGCSDLQNDITNCGACGNACGSGQMCSFGGCSPLQGTCTTCGVYITEGDPNLPPLCDASVDLYNQLVDCVCAGACADVCGPNICSGIEIDVACQDCVTNSETGCGNQFAECANDI